ncbi:starch-binding domain-containing protein 1 isoform X1 [Rhinoderma darwinii]|uniref:starch-binding domain-containing protein 1 isoform X1 n=1 Tax=Rhinoderma darwinii TaxID=43563 RepID=UPI003F67BA68
MVQAAAALQSQSPVQGKQVSGSRSSMWPVLVLGILTAIFAWIWYRESGEGKGPEVPVQNEEAVEATTVTPERVESKHSPLAALRESKLNAAGPETYNPPSSEQEVPCREMQGNGVVKTEVYQAEKEQQPKDKAGPSDVERPEDVQSDAAPVPLNVHVLANVVDPLTEVPTKGELRGDVQEQKNHVPMKEKLRGNLKAHSTAVPKTEDSQADIEEHSTALPKTEDSQADIEEHSTALPKTEDSQADIEEHSTALPKTEGSQADMEELTTDVPKTEGSQADMEELPTDVPKTQDPKANGHEHPQGNVDRAVVQANGEVILPTLITEKPGALKLLDDSSHASMTEHEDRPGKECLPPVNVNQNGVTENGEANGANQAAEDATGCPLKNVFINASSDDGNIVPNPFMQEESAGSLDNANVFAIHLNESTRGEISDVQKLGTGLENSAVDKCNSMPLLSNQEKEMSGLKVSNPNEKTSLDNLSESNIHEIDHQKTKKVATIQPMPQNVNFVFKVHYITNSDSQFIAVTGDHENFGKWGSYVPLTSRNGDFWSRSITLPADTNVAWKLVMVENGKIKRWEECNNRFLKIAHEDIETQLCWGYP